jgi:C1A family cysteine protease
MKKVFFQGLVTPARDQMSCGSCAAFAATGAHETCMLKAGARMNGLDLSEQGTILCNIFHYK